jgi:hypothetical protein
MQGSDRIEARHWLQLTPKPMLTFGVRCRMVVAGERGCGADLSLNTRDKTDRYTVEGYLCQSASGTLGWLLTVASLSLINLAPQVGLEPTTLRLTGRLMLTPVVGSYWVVRKIHRRNAIHVWQISINAVWGEVSDSSRLVC